MTKKSEKNFARCDVFIDPGVENHKAIHVYEKAGFAKREEFTPEWDPTGRSLLMQFKMDKSQGSFIS